MTILHIDSSINGENSASRTVSHSIVEQLKSAQWGEEVVYRDLASNPLSHLTLDAFADTSVLDEFLAADTIVIGAPMYNFTLPSQLKAWIDRILIAGKTFRYTAEGPEGLAGGRRVIVALARGGFYDVNSPAASLEHLETYLRGRLQLHRHRTRIRRRRRSRRQPGATRGIDQPGARNDDPPRGLTQTRPASLRSPPLATAHRASAVSPRPGLAFIEIGEWWARRDSNPQPSRYERPALPLSYRPPPGSKALAPARQKAQARSCAAAIPAPAFRPSYEGLRPLSGRSPVTA